ncbi:MAG: ferrous-iron efflux pump FieF [Halieaceae bacterium]|jgi:ferrous-iron efflux pump FieF
MAPRITTGPGAGSSETAALMRLATYASVSIALLLIGAKSYAYLSTGAVSLLASLVDSVMDAAASLINLFAVRYALVPADREHRFGHGKAEALAALLQAGFIIASSAFLIHEAVYRLLEPQPVEAVSVGVAVMVLAIVLTLALLAIQRYVIRRTNSAAIKADALHYRADLLSNTATIVALVLASFGLGNADPLFALAIAGYLLFSTREILQQALSDLLDRELPDIQRRAIIRLAESHAEVHGVHDVRTRMSGRTPIVQLHLELNGEMPLRQAHVIADEVEQAIIGAFPDADVVIHQDPAGLVEEQRFTHLE